MGNVIRLQYVPPAAGASGPGDLQVDVEDAELVGREAKLSFSINAEVRARGGIDVDDVVASRDFVLADHQRFPLPPDLGSFYRFSGHQLSIEIFAEVKVAGQGSEDLLARLELGPKIAAQRNVAEIAAPRRFNYTERFKASPFPLRQLVAILAIAGPLLVLGSIGLGLHDQFAPDDQQIVFSRDAKARFRPMGLGLLIAMGSGFGFLAALRYGLSRHLELELHFPGRVGPGSRVPARELVSIRTNAPLRQARVRVVAFNFEQGQFEMDKSKEKLGSIENPVRAVCLFQQDLENAPANQDLAALLEGEINFGRAYRELLPPCTVGYLTGIELGWELELHYEGCVDKKRGDPGIFNAALFDRPAWPVSGDGLPS